MTEKILFFLRIFLLLCKLCRPTVRKNRLLAGFTMSDYIIHVIKHKCA